MRYAIGVAGQKYSRGTKKSLWVVPMEKWVECYRKLAPEAIQLSQERYGILRELRDDGTLGRRALAQNLGISERIARQHVEFLKNSNLVNGGSGGAFLTDDGKEALQVLNLYIRQMSGMTALENQLKEKLGLSEVVVVPGDSDQDRMVLHELGRAGADLLSQHLEPHSILAVSGGSTLAQVAKGVHRTLPEVVVVPARGGLGEEVEPQANTIASVFAKGLEGNYRMLHVPDGLDSNAIEVLRKSSADVGEILDLIQKSDVLVHGIGGAVEMAQRRKVQPEALKKIKAGKAVGEALGYYFTATGKPVHETGGVGIKITELERIRFVLAVSGGGEKGAAILAVLRSGGQDGLVTDEGAAKEMLRLLG